MSDIKSKPVLDFKSNTYQLKDPNVGSLLDIEMMKAALTGNKYGSIVSHGTIISNWNLDNVDMFSHLMVLCPGLVGDIKAESWREMSIPDIVELKDEYMLKFIPWFENQLSFLNPSVKADKEEGKETV